MERFIDYGASPRATINLIEGARALAFLRGRRYVLTEDVTDLAADVLRHRVVLTYEALAEAISADLVIGRILAKVPAPEKPLESHAKSFIHA
jgi:MoxR-like ATPase